ncbi:MAG: nitroreductase family protein [Bacteroidetes bacterium]|nr:MAG: nitroreductase family protein [Bacteroidota bacterium]
MKEGFLPYTHPVQFSSDQELVEKSAELNHLIQGRRSIREFSTKAIPQEVIDNLIQIAASAPSGAHKQPWTFCVVSSDDFKTKIREAAEKEEYVNYNGRMGEEWLKDLKKFGTNWHKEFLTTAPYLVVVFKKSYDMEADGGKTKNYYVNESVGIACGFLLSAIHQLGLVSLTHTPSPMNFLAQLLERPVNEKAFLLIPIGYAANDAAVPNIERKPLREVMNKY